MKGPSMIKKYFKDPKNTAYSIDWDGWVHTGDIGVILPNGALKIIDRKKVFISFNKVNMSRHKKYRIYIQDLNMLQRHFCMVILSKVIMLLLSIQILNFYLV
jgi:hypothetical protein